jgi:hypothetical protein
MTLNYLYLNLKMEKHTQKPSADRSTSDEMSAFQPIHVKISILILTFHISIT